MSEKFQIPRSELEENIQALKRMRVVVWMFAAILLGTLCFLAGLMVGRW